MLNRLRILLVALLAVLSSLGVAFAQNLPADTPWENWQTQQNAKHPLVGKIYSVKDDKLIDPYELAVRLQKQRHVLLGETHDNADHHKLQAWIIAQLTAMERTPSIVMEQIRIDQAGILKLFMSGKHKTAERMGPAIGWDKSGWPKWPLYQPIATSALKANLPIFAGDTAKQMNRKIGKQGFKALPEDEINELGLHLPLGRKLDDALAEDLVGSHCNMMPKKMMGPMALIQRYRDAHLARAMRQADRKDGSILIAGNGHVRTDRAVPWYLRGDHINSTTVMIVEASKDAKSALDLIPLGPSGKATADYIWITPGAKREDQCEKLRKQFGGKHGMKKQAK